MNAKPNALQKFMHQILMLRSVTAFFAPRVHEVDKAIPNVKFKIMVVRGNTSQVKQMETDAKNIGSWLYPITQDMNNIKFALVGRPL